LALSIYKPEHRRPPQEEDASARELHKVRNAIPWSPDPALLHARAGALLLVLGEARHARGEKDLARKAYEDAAFHFEAALERNPLDAASHREITLVLERLGRREEADRYADRAARLAPSRPDLQFKVGLFFFERRAFRQENDKWVVDPDGLAKAFGCFRRAAAVDSAYLDRALNLVKEHIPGWTRFDELVPETVSARLRFARFLAGQGRWRESAKVEEAVLTDGEDEPAHRIRAGVARLKAGGFSEATAHFRRAFSLGRLSAGQVRQISRAFHGAEAMEQGLEFFLSLEHLEPEEVLPVIKALGRLYKTLGRFREAEEQFTRAAVEWSDSEAYYTLALLAERAGDLHSAERNLKQAIRGQRDVPEYHHRLGHVLEGMKHLGEAIREYQTAVRMAPDRTDWRGDLARAEKRWKEGR
jgi:tetratricopeptide (TPR) repeat protein